ncbi:MAG: M20/M25/M40 family metallo-hydrolase, partial [Patescibacteria group bacterium]|nr:M20/M25/M40 family metallo-hydrolase [Patescibacteria group bacterium]
MVEITTLTQELIAIPSLSGKEKAVQEFLFQKLTEMGSEPFFQGENLVLHLKGKDGSRSFVFNSHVDVVDPGEISRWKYSPWEAVIAEDRLYGRGAADMKAGVAASATVAKELLKQKDDLPTDVWFVFVTKEETDGSGTKSFTEWFKSQGYWDQYQQIGAVFTEPTFPLR